MVTWGKARKQFLTCSFSPALGSGPPGPHQAMVCRSEVEGQEEEAPVAMVTMPQHLQTGGEWGKTQAGFLNSTRLPHLFTASPQDTNDLEISVKTNKSILTHGLRNTCPQTPCLHTHTYTQSFTGFTLNQKGPIVFANLLAKSCCSF